MDEFITPPTWWGCFFKKTLDKIKIYDIIGDINRGNRIEGKQQKRRIIMKKLLLIIALFAAVFCADTAMACSSGRCGYYGRSYYGRSYTRHYNRGYRHYNRGYLHYGRSFGRHYNRGYRHFSRGYGRCTRCGYSRW